MKQIHLCLAGIFQAVEERLENVLFRQGFDELDGLNQFLMTLVPDLIHAQCLPDARVVTICEGLAVLKAPVADGVVCGMWQGADSLKYALDWWEIFSDYQWRVMITDWLSRRLGDWHNDQGRPVLCSGHAPDSVFHGEYLRGLARQAISLSLDDTHRLRMAVLEALGYSRALVATLVRACRYPGGTSSAWREAMVAAWSGKHLWPGRSRKLLPLAAVAFRHLSCPSLAAAEVRDCYRVLGLSRNGWAHLIRLPRGTLQLLAVTLTELPDHHSRALFLKEVSQRLSRFGNRYRYYRLDTGRINAALVEISGWAMLFQQTFVDGVGDDVIFPGRVSRELQRCRRQGLSDELRARVQFLFLAFSDELMTSAASVDVVMGQISEVMDWFMDAGENLPARWFRKQSFAGLLSRSDAWHQARLDDAFCDEAAELSWSATVTRLEHDGVVFEALLSNRALWAEGQRMRHCVGGYAQLCLQGDTLIYAVSVAGDRLGTLELSRDIHGWDVVQFRGRHNRQLLHLVESAGEFHEPALCLLEKLNECSRISHAGVDSCRGAEPNGAHNRLTSRMPLADDAASA